MDKYLLLIYCLFILACNQNKGILERDINKPFIIIDSDSTSEYNFEKVDEIIIYKHPMMDAYVFYLPESYDLTSTTVSIHSKSGQLIKEFVPDDHVNYLNKSDFPPGKYFYQIVVRDEISDKGKFKVK